MQMQILKTIFLCGIALILLSGCHGQARPAGLPALIPVEITISQEGKPLADAGVSLVSSDGSIRWTVGGKTDENGVAKLKTHGDFDGAPAGTYKVVVTKLEHELKKNRGPDLPPLTEEDLAKIDPKMYDATMVDSFWLTEATYMSVDKTPLEVIIAKGANKLELDAGKAVRRKK